MNTVHRFTNRSAVFFLRVTIFVIFFPGISGIVCAETFTVSGTITRGSCVVNMPDTDVVFIAPAETQRLTTNTGDTTYTTPFTFRYACSGFDTSSGPSVGQLIKITPANGTRINSDNKIFPDADVQNAGFVLRQCGGNETDCRVVSFTSSVAEIPAVVTHNGDLETQFEVSIVKISEQPAQSGNLVAAVDLTLIQP